MRTGFSVISVIVLAVLVIISPSPRAQWLEGGTEICHSYGSSGNPEIIATEDGCFIIAWIDSRSGVQSVYVQKVDARGNALWAEDGVEVLATSYSMWNQKIASDGAGGVFIVCSTTALEVMGEDIYLQRIDADGNDAWGWGGFFMTYSMGDQRLPDICEDGSGGAYLVWQDHRGSSLDIYAHHITHEGSVDWPSDGRAVSLGSGDQKIPDLAYDNSGGAVVTWEDERTDSGDIYAQRMDVDGNMLWVSNGVAVCNSGYEQYMPEIVCDDGGNSIIVWSDFRNNTDHDIYAQRYDVAGNFLWSAGGKLICDAAGSQIDPRIAPDGDGGALVAWADLRGGDRDVYAAKLLPGGYVTWQDDGRPVCTESDSQYLHAIVCDDDGGVYISWTDYRTGTPNNYIQHLTEGSVPLWGTNGKRIGQDTYSYYPSLGFDPTGGLVVAYDDHRYGVNFGIYAERFTPGGEWGVPEPEIESVIDVPLDEGGYVNVRWRASDHDLSDSEVTNYSVWRAIGQPQAMVAFDSGARMIKSAGDLEPGTGERVIRHELLGSTDYYWEYLYWVDAVHIATYSETVPTLYDSMGTSVPWHYFQVIAHTSDEMTFWVSGPDSGYSVDDLAPAMPVGLVGTPDEGPLGITIEWEPNTEPDLAFYSVYRGSDPAFDPSESTLLETTFETEIHDANQMWTIYTYKICAVDIHGNESECAVLGSGMITGDDPLPLPNATFLSQNHPNPFNPLTAIEFGLKDSGRVSLRVFDSAGRLVATLVDGSKPAGRWTVEWNGKDSAGRSVTSGVYFYRLDAGGFTETRKMIMLK